MDTNPDNLYLPALACKGEQEAECFAANSRCEIAVLCDLCHYKFGV